MKASSLIRVLLLAMVLVFSFSLTAFAAVAEIPRITEHPQSADYMQGEDIEPLSATVFPAGYTIISWEWFNDDDDLLDSNAEDPLANSTYTPDISEPGTYTYYAKVKLRRDIITVVNLQPMELVTNSATITIMPEHQEDPNEPDEFEVKKVDEEDDPLSGAVFVLEGEEDYQATSRSNGYATFTGVVDGNYDLREKTAPDGYTKSSDTYDVAVKNGVFHIHIDGTYRPYSRMDVLVFIDTKIEEEPDPEPEYDLRVKKTDNKNQPLAGAIFELKGESGSYSATSQSDGFATFNNVAYGQYTLSEKSAPDGYDKSNETHKIKVSTSGVYLTDNNTSRPHKMLTYVNRKIPQLNKEDHFAFLTGYPDGTFGPSRNMTRAEVTAMFARLLVEQMDMGQRYPSSFSDINPGEWYADEVGYMEGFGIVTGYPDGTFRPDDPITRAEFAVIASRFDKLTEGTITFSDVPSSHWAAPYITFAATRGWVSGYPDGTFRPDNYIIRSEVTSVTCRILERSADKSYVDSNYSVLPRTYSDIDASHWAFYFVMESSNGHDYTRVGLNEIWTGAYK